MSKILVDSGEYFKLKNRINELLETNKKLKEKYVYLEKRIGLNVDLSILEETIETLKNDANKLNQKIDNLENENKIIRDTNFELETKNNNIQKENNKLNKMLEEFIRPRKNKTEVKPVKKEFNLEEFNKEYNEFIEKLKKNKKNETV